ncbi:MAG: HEAT repeat domain-containing protein [Acidobacteria bacterium]|nr:MAG: HEAT repeat domain-containing protein [Acidobacteriota bacterium]REK10507.1 MAG: HEAT repeat domain-containing protein [Acidobacteriota bacterium]
MTGRARLPVPGPDLVLQAASLLIGLTAIACLALIALLVLRRWREVRRQRARWRVLAQLAPCFFDPDRLGLAAVETAGEYGFELVSRVLHEARRELGGKAGRAIDDALEVLGEQARLRRRASSWSRRRRLSAIDVLGRCGGSSAALFLRRMLAHPDPVTRRFVRSALAELPSQAGRRAALDSFAQDERDPQGWGATFLARIGRTAPEELLDWVQRREVGNRHRKLVLEALGDVHYAAAADLAIELLDSEDPELRASAARLLGRLGGPGSQERIAAALEDPVWFVRSAAAGTLDGLGPLHAGTVERLVSCLADPSWWVRHNAARTLSSTALATGDAALAADSPVDRGAAGNEREQALLAWGAARGDSASAGAGGSGEDSVRWTVH